MKLDEFVLKYWEQRFKYKTELAQLREQVAEIRKAIKGTGIRIFRITHTLNSKIKRVKFIDVDKLLANIEEKYKDFIKGDVDAETRALAKEYTIALKKYYSYRNPLELTPEFMDAFLKLSLDEQRYVKCLITYGLALRSEFANLQVESAVEILKKYEDIRLKFLVETVRSL